MDKIQELNQRIKTCNNCKLNPKRTLVGYGKIPSKYMIIGESPSIQGTKEDIPIFMRKSKIVIDMILELIGKTKDDVYFTNIIKCSEPFKKVGNEEKCKPYLLEEIDVVNPKILIFLSSKAAKTVYPHKVGPCYFRENSRDVILFRHPAYALRSNSTDKYLAQFTSMLLLCSNTKEKGTQTTLI